jgi:hypothetical protein
MRPIMTKQLADKVILTAERMMNNFPFNESAKICLDDAKALYAKENYSRSVERAERAIRHVAGISAEAC